MLSYRWNCKSLLACWVETLPRGPQYLQIWNFLLCRCPSPSYFNLQLMNMTLLIITKLIEAVNRIYGLIPLAVESSDCALLVFYSTEKAI